MPFNGHLKVPDIEGESVRADHEGEIDIFGASWSVVQETSATQGRGRVQGRAHASAFTFQKYMDASSPYLTLACLQGKSFDEVVFSVRKDSGEAHLDYLVVTLTNVIVSSYDMSGGGDQQIMETVSLMAEKVKILYTVQADDHSAGDEHEIEYDLVAGA